MLITMGCGEECPYVPGVERDDWALPDPKGRPVEEVRAIRDDIRARVAALVAREAGESSDVVARSHDQGALICPSTSPRACRFSIAI